jgi:hypothetical protein
MFWRDEIDLAEGTLCFFIGSGSEFCFLHLYNECLVFYSVGWDTVNHKK